MAWLKGKEDDVTVYINTDNILAMTKYSNGNVHVLTAPGCYYDFKKGNLEVCTEQMMICEVVE